MSYKDYPEVATYTECKGIHKLELIIIIGVILALALIGSSVEYIAKLLESLF